MAFTRNTLLMSASVLCLASASWAAPVIQRAAAATTLTVGKASGGKIAVANKFAALAAASAPAGTPTAKPVSNAVTNTAAATPMMDTSRLCSQNFARAEREMGIPKQLVQAISMSESGRWSDEARTVVPWPWTINAQGQGYYFDTMHEAVTFARRLQLQGVESMDVGCMQVNLKHHPKAFASLTDAFNPASNVAYGAKFLRSNYDDLGNWQQAIAAYHSRGTAKGREYYANVRKNWQRALGGPMEYASASDVVFNGRTRDYGVSPRNRVFSISVKDGETSRVMGSAQERSESKLSSRMKVMQVGKDTGSFTRVKSPEVLVVRPYSAGTEMASAASTEAAYAEIQTPQEAQLASSAVHASSGPLVKRVSTRQKGPNFIFD